MKRRRALVAAVAGLALALAVGALVRPWVDEYTGSAPPPQFDRPLASPPDTHGRDVLAVAHNAGNDPDTTAAALRHGADAIEIDVIIVDHVLAAGRPHGWRWLADLLFRGHTLAQAWRDAEPAKIIQLDLQDTDRELLDALIRFLHRAPAGPQVMVSTRDSAAIGYLRPRLPGTVTLLFSVPFPDAVTQIHTDPALVDAIGGITVFDGLVDIGLVGWAHHRNLLVLAWTVNDERSLNRLLRDGVDGITTDNLAILGALSR